MPGAARRCEDFRSRQGIALLALPFNQGSEVYEHLEDWRRDRTDLPVSYDYLYDKRAIIGTPEQCLAKILELKNAGAEIFGGNFAFGGMDDRKVRQSMELFAKKVMPHL